MAYRHADRHKRMNARIEGHSTLSASEAASYVEALARALRDGEMLIRVGERAVGLQLGDDITMQLRAEQSPTGTSRIMLDLSWPTPNAAPPPPPLEITSIDAPAGFESSNEPETTNTPRAE